MSSPTLLFLVVIATLVIMASTMFTSTHANNNYNANSNDNQYQPDLVLAQPRDLTLTPESPIAFFRVQVPKSLNSSFFEVFFSACSAGTVRVYHSKCLLGSAGCNDGSAQWFPNRNNAQSQVYTVIDSTRNLQATQSIGRIANNQGDDTVQYMHFFGVEMASRDLNNQLTIQVLMRYYKDNSIAHTFSSSPLVTLNPANLKLSWAELDYCGKASEVDPTKCEVEIPIDPVEYTVFLVNANKKENVNFGAACGLFHASKNVKRIKTSKSATQLDISSQLSASGTFLVGVGADVPTQAFTVDYAYQPLAITIQSRTVTSYRPLLVLFILVLIGSLIAAAAAGAYYFYKKRVSGSSEEFRTLT